MKLLAAQDAENRVCESDEVNKIYEIPRIYDFENQNHILTDISGT